MINYLMLLSLAFILILSAGSTFAMDDSSDLQNRLSGTIHMEPYMNVFRRYDSDPEEMFKFYGKALGFEQLMTFDIGGGTKVARFQAGDSQVKLSGFVPNRTYLRNDISEATGLRLLTFFFQDQQTLEERFRTNGFPVPVFESVPGLNRKRAIVRDPDGMWVELIIVKDAEMCKGIEIGLVVSDLDKSREFYGKHVGLKEMPPEKDIFLNTTKYPFKNGSTVVSLRCFGPGLPADTGSGGIQYVVADAHKVDRLARANNLVIDQPLNLMKGFALLTIWLDDPDGIINYFAQVGVKEEPVSGR